jgi:hypothetical protein
MIPCPWRFSTVSSFQALPTRQGQGIVSPLHLQKGDGPNFRKKRTVPLSHLKVIYGQEEEERYRILGLMI